MPHKRDKNHQEVIKALRDRCGGFERDKEHGHYYANLHGLRVACYDMHTRGQGFPDFEIWVSWLCVLLEVKQERVVKAEQANSGQFKQILSDHEYYYRQLEDTEKDFHAAHPGLLFIVWDSNQVYDILCLMADFVEYVEGLSHDKKPLFRLFFPKVDEPEKTSFDITA